jgi:uracil-DNA glycosylase family 4
VSDAYVQLLDAAIAHCEALRADGVDSVPVSAATLAELSARPAAPARATRPPIPAAPVSRPAEPRPFAFVPAGTPGAPAAAPASPPPSPAPYTPRPLPASVASRWGQAAQLPSPSVPKSPAPAPAQPPLPPPLAPAAKEAAMNELRTQVLGCIKCAHLASSRTTVVFGVGDIHARLMFVGEAPGADEDRQGEPFVGKAGELLTKMILAMGLTRADVYIANILKCRPDTPGQTAGNRKPTTDEMATCTPWLHRQIDIIQPAAMVALGATAVEGLLGKTIGITKLRGTWQTYRGIPLMPTYHPAYLLRNQAPAEKRKVWEDLLAVMEKLALPINAKQRGYFLPKP